MSSFSQELSSFVVEAKFEDLPEAVVHEVKRLLLDSIGCAIAATACDRGRIAIELARRLGGAPESSIIGTPDKVSCCSAAFANGDLINAMDYDAIEVPHGHLPPCLIPPPLAVAESIGASGKDLILATALSFESERRIHQGLTPRTGIIDPKRGSVRLAWGESQYVFGGTVGAGKILKLDKGKMAHALTIAVHFCPVPTGATRQENPVPLAAMTKYGHTGWPSMGAVTAALLAEMGYTGDTTLFDGERGFWRIYSYGKWEPEKAMDKIGETWLFLGLGFKPYPCHRAFHGPLDCFMNIIDQNNLIPEEIERVKVLGNPKMMTKRPSIQLESHIQAQFTMPYIFACAAHRVRVEDWQTQDTMMNPKILEFMKKISAEGLPDWEERVGSDRRRVWGGGVEVMARGKTFREDRMYARGTASTDVAMTDEELVDKFRRCASRILSQDKIDAAIKYLLELEAVENVRELMEQVSL